MDDAELAAIRAARLQEMQRNSPGGSGAGSGQGSPDPVQSIMSQILTPAANERLSRVRMVKPDRVTAVENYLVRLFQTGAIKNRVGEDDIVEILDKLAKDERRSNETKIVFDRRDYAGVGGAGDDDDDDDFFD
ncbi:hypothetical protein CANARDRAFT_199315 [[Candida] arabinofermentans NRRL YB-2248]|uniref:DNA-binding TFAR19-related protein n=1 Tax=[Candida] arabinofermentans NRRL YB-2248 TaxID=983967 RepID=A0A1E4T0I4_9ASCO|nr:hypothetical protein CANARDRAFT_199315 [[Candida] arabinofermentans NRRL YB-2248]